MTVRILVGDWVDVLRTLPNCTICHGFVHSKKNIAGEFWRKEVMPSDGENPSRGLGGGAENATIRECTHDLYFSAVLLTASVTMAHPVSSALSARWMSTSRGWSRGSGKCAA